MNLANHAQRPSVLIALQLEEQPIAEPLRIFIDGFEHFVGARRIGALHEPQRFDLLRLGLAELIELEQRARHAVEQLDLLRVVQAVSAPAHGARFPICRDGARVVIGLVIIVAEARQRADRERRERSVDRTICLDSREIGFCRFVEVLFLALCVREIELRFGRLQAARPVLRDVALEHPLTRCDGIDGLRRNEIGCVDAGVIGRLSN